MSKNRRRFFLNGILLTIVALATRSVGMLFNSYITKAVGAEGIGLYTLIMTVYSFAVTFATSGIGLTVTGLVAKAIGADNPRGVRSVLRCAVLYSLIFSIFAGCTLFFLSEYFALRVLGDQRCIRPLRVLAVSLVPIALQSVLSGYFIGVRRVARNASVGVLSQIFKILFTLIAVLRYSSSAADAVLALAVAATLTELFGFLASLFQYLAYRRRVRRSSVGKRVPFSELLAMALPLALSAYIRSALLTLEHILIPKRLRDSGRGGAEALADYGILHGMVMPVLLYPMSPLSSFSGLLVPEFAEAGAKGEQGRMCRIAGEALNATLSFATVCAVLLSLFAEEVGYALYSSYSAGRYIAMMAPVIPIMYLDHVTDSILKGIGEQVYSMWVNIIDSTLSVILVCILIPLMGISGYAVVIVAMEGFNFLLSYIRLRRRLRFKLNILSSFFVPLFISSCSAIITRRLFAFVGAGASFRLLLPKLVFSVCIFLAPYILIRSCKNKKHPRLP